MNTLKVSVIVPVYNVEKYLKQCLDSIINQTMRDIEIICINDGSTDGSLSVLEYYALKDNRIKIIDKKNGGLSSARNSGLRKAEGEYISFVDSDDWIDGNFLETLYDAAVSNDADISRAPYKECFSDKQVDGYIVKLFALRHSKKDTLGVNEHSIIVWNSLYRHSFLKSVFIGGDCFDENILGAEDIPFTVRTSFSAKKIVPTVETYYYYRKNVQNQLSIFSVKRSENIVLANKSVVNFLNSIEVKNTKDYLEAFKRVIWRYDDTFRRIRKMEDFSAFLKESYINCFIAEFHKCKYMDEFLRNYYEDYFKFLVNKDVKGYMLESASEKYIVTTDKLGNLSGFPIMETYMNIPKVSVIIPVYNVEKYLKQCLDSITNQTLRDIEIICIDDSSTDNSLNILYDFAKKDERVKILRQQNFGAAAARNAGLEAAAGEYVSFIDSDDWADVNFLDVLYNEAKTKDADIARTLYKYHYGTTVKESGINKMLVNRYKAGKFLGINEHSITIWNAVYKLSFLKEKKINYFDASLKQGHDIPFTARVTFSAGKIVPCKGTYYHHRENVDKQLSAFSVRRAKNLKRANRLVIAFLNSSSIGSEMAYIEAFKRVMWRYDNILQKMRQLKGVKKSLLKVFVKHFIEDFHKCKYMDEFLKTYKEDYFKFLINKDIKGYINFCNRKKLRRFIKKVFSVESKDSHKTFRILGIKAKFKYK
ncbi:MAG: glycosyltransferase [Endomicrobium sp.]|jgi:glycosyltransferase involved in cell wall biosynthesis|nr:glycosyltransferase [Endomicrobium sp.]